MGILLLMILLSFLPGLLGDVGIVILYVGFVYLMLRAVVRIGRRLDQNAPQDNLMLAAGLWVMSRGISGGNSR